MVATSSQYNFGQEFPETIDLITLTKYAWDFQNNALWDTLKHSLLRQYPNQEMRAFIKLTWQIVNIIYEGLIVDPNSANLIITGYVRSVPTHIYFLLQYKVIKKMYRHRLRMLC